MKGRSAWLFAGGSMILLATFQADLAFASLLNASSYSTVQQISSGSWVVFPSANPSSIATGSAYGPITPWAQSPCNPIAGSQLTKVITITFSNSRNNYKDVTLNDVTGLSVGMAVTESAGNNIVNSGTNLITDIVGNKITLAKGTGPGVQNSGTGNLYFDVAATVANSTWTPAGSGSSNKVTVRVDMIALIVVGMSVTGTGIVNSGSNTVAGTSTSSGNKYVTLAMGGNTSAKDIILVFRTADTCVFPPPTYNEFFTLNSTGTIDVLKVALTTSSGLMTVQSCSGTWNESARTCSGSISSIITDGLSHSLPISAGANIRLRVVSSAANTSTTISSSVTTSDLPLTQGASS